MVGFEYLAILHAQETLTREWPHGLVEDALADRMPKAISLTEVQEQENADLHGGGYRSPGAPEVFAELVGLGVLRPVTADQFHTIQLVIARTKTPIKTDDQSVWFDVVPDVLKVLYPEQL
jgi:hypothetical protein